MTKFSKGDQIIYIPTHAEGDESHPDCEKGFVTSCGAKTVHCRFWHRDKPGVLRTRLNSEGARVEDVNPKPYYIPQEIVDAWISIIDWENS